MADREEVGLDVATEADGELLANLLELYLHDLSEAFPIEPGSDGRFGYDKLPLYWAERAQRFPFLIRHEGRVAGFVLVVRGLPAVRGSEAIRGSEAVRGSGARHEPDVFDIAEFFVLRRHRRAGVGRRAAFLLWDRLAGRWTVRVSEGNRGAVPFWRGIIAEYTRGTAMETQRPGDPNAWRVFSFDSRRPPAA